MKIAYLGPEGSFSHIACANLFSSNPLNTQLELIPAISLSKLIFDLEAGAYDKAVIPIENSLAGGVAETIDTLLKTTNVYVTKEYLQPIEHCLIAKQDLQLHEIQQVYAHTMSFGQCFDYLHNNCPEAKLETSSSNSKAALQVSQSSKGNIAAIAPKLSAEIYNLTVLAEKINDEPNNITRFWVLSKQLESEGATKTTIVFEIKDQPGSLEKILVMISDAGVNLSRIESRPSRKNLGEYRFVLDLNINNEDPVFLELLKKLKMFFTYYKCLGSYSII